MFNPVIIGMVFVAIIVGVVGLYLRRKTIIYVDISGSMIHLQPVMKGKLNSMLGLRLNRFNTILKPFDHQVREPKPFTRAAVDVITSYTGGGSDIKPVVTDYRSSNAKAALVLTDGMLVHPATIPGLKVVEIA